MKPIEENPFSEEQIQGFNTKQIVYDLQCGICNEISIQAQECVKCSQLFCLICIKSWKSSAKQLRCPMCSNPNWDLKNPHKVYTNLLSRLQFKCADPNCIECYTIDTYKSHQHKYLAENQLMYEFFLRNKDNVCQEVDQALGKELEKKYKEKAGKFINYISNNKYEFNFSDLNNLRAIKLETNEQFTLFRNQCEIPQEYKRYQWVFYCNDSDDWVKYNAEYNTILNEYYTTFVSQPESNKKYLMKINNQDYEFDFCNLHQIRQSTQYKRSIFRCPVIKKMRFFES